MIENATIAIRLKGCSRHELPFNYIFGARLSRYRPKCTQAYGARTPYIIQCKYLSVCTMYIHNDEKKTTNNTNNTSMNVK
jgi:hypothetical protein